MTTDAHNLHRHIQLALGQGDVRLFRQNVGMGWTGTVRHMGGDTVLITNARPLHAGLCTGSSDLIGWRSLVVTPAHVGQQMALFAAIEAKTGKGRPSHAQLCFVEAVCRAGGLAGIAHSVEEAAAILSRK